MDLRVSETPENWRKILSGIVTHSRPMNQDQRLGQTLYNAIQHYDKTDNQNYDLYFHARLFSIEDGELNAALKQWFEYMDKFSDNKDTSTGPLDKLEGSPLEGIRAVGAGLRALRDDNPELDERKRLDESPSPR